MDNLVQYLQAELAAAKAEAQAAKVEVARLTEALAKLQHLVRGLLRGRFRRATEKPLGITPPDQTLIAEIQAFLEHEATAKAAPSAETTVTAETFPAETPPAMETAVIEKPKPKAKRGIRQHPSEAHPGLEVRPRVVEVPEADVLSGRDSGTWLQIHPGKA